MYAHAQQKTKPQLAHHAGPSEEEILGHLKSQNVPTDDLKTILDKIKQLNPRLKDPHLLVGKYRAGVNLGGKVRAKPASSAAGPTASAAYKYPAEIVDGALYLYATNKGALFINSLIRKEKGQVIDIPDTTQLARHAKMQFEAGENRPPFAPGIDIKNVIKTLSKKGQAIVIMNQAVETAKTSGINSYYRGTRHRPVLDVIKPGDVVSANFLMSVTESKRMAERFAEGVYNTAEDQDELGVIYDIIGNPHDFKFGDPVEKERLFPVGAKFKYIGREGTTYRFVEQSATEMKKYKGDIYRLYR